MKSCSFSRVTCRFSMSIYSNLYIYIYSSQLSQEQCLPAEPLTGRENFIS